MICTCKRFLVGLRLHIANRHPFTPLLCCQGTIHLLLERRWPGSIHSCAAPGSFGKPVVTSTIKPMARLCLKFLSGVTFGKMPKWLAVYLGWEGIATSTLAPGGNYSPLNFKFILDVYLLAFYTPSVLGWVCQPKEGKWSCNKPCIAIGYLGINLAIQLRERSNATIHTLPQADLVKRVAPEPVQTVLIRFCWFQLYFNGICQVSTSFQEILLI